MSTSCSGELISQCMTKLTMRLVQPAKTQISLPICTVWSESLLISCAFYSLPAIHRGMNKNLCHTGWMNRLIWVFAGHTGLIVGFVVCWLKSIICAQAKSKANIRFLLTLLSLNFWNRISDFGHCRSWWDGSLSAISSGSTLFANVFVLVCRMKGLYMPFWNVVLMQCGSVHFSLWKRKVSNVKSLLPVTKYLPCVKSKAPGPSVVPAAKLYPIAGLHVFTWTQEISYFMLKLEVCSTIQALANNQLLAFWMHALATTRARETEWEVYHQGSGKPEK